MKFNENIDVFFHDGRLHIQMRKAVPMVISAEDRFRKGIEMNFCTGCGSYCNIVMWGSGGVRLCDSCTELHFKEMEEKGER